MPPLRYGVNGRFVGDAYMRPVGRFGSREVPRSGQDRSLQSSRERCTVGRGLDPSGDIAGRHSCLPWALPQARRCMGGKSFAEAPVGGGVPDAPQMGAKQESHRRVAVGKEMIIKN